MKRYFIFLVLLFLPAFFLFAAEYVTVPIDNEAYKIIEFAEINGQIPIQTKVRPYDYYTVRTLLDEIRGFYLNDENALKRIDYTLKDLERKYGKSEIKEKKDVLYNGLYRTSNPENGNNFSIGVWGAMNESLGLDNDKNKIIDLRNTGTLFFSGDLFNILSFNMNASMKLDALNPRAYLTEEFLYDADGDYFFGAGSDETYVNTFTNELDGVHLGFKASPELSAVFLKRHLILRFGSFKRDWGPGVGNLVLSKTAPEFTGVELYIKPASWFDFSVLTGSLNRSYVKSIYEIRRPGYESSTEPEVTTPLNVNVAYDNMFSIQRMEFNIKNKAQIALYESVVWQRRLELAYLNPFSIYWFAQSLTGDIDSLIGGVDVTLNLKKIGQVYFSLSVDEFSADLENLFTNVRNITALQAGLRLPGRLLGSFTTFTLQGTYIPPFYGTHHYQENKDGTWYGTSYVNRGFNLFYPMNPDSLEFLFDCDVSFSKGYGLKLTVKDQMRSAQYAIGANGTDILTVLNYSKDDLYSKKEFFSNIWNNIFDIKLVFSKKFSFLPMNLSIGLEGIFEWSKDYSTSLSYDSAHIRYNSGYYNRGHVNSVAGKDWKSADVRVLGSVLFSLYY